MINLKHTFSDLFAGIGGTRIAFEEVGCQCIFSSEWDKYSQITYEANFGEKPYGDITKIKSYGIPDHDILVAGFPCQPFSISGVSKKNALGRPHGFDDPTQGTLFFELKRILHGKIPSAFRIWLNLELAKRPLRCLEYIVVHEMLHLIVRTHNEIFIAHLDRHVPQWRNIRRELNAFISSYESWSH